MPSLNINYPLILDGGLSNVLEGQGCDLNHKLWTAHLLDKNPEVVIEAHLAYLKAGAQCITTASYQASMLGLKDVGYTLENAKALLLKSVQLAEIAIQRAYASNFMSSKPLIAASLGPYGAYLADGSEYRGDYGVSDETLRTFHLERIAVLEKSKADLLAFETIPSLQETNVIAQLLRNVAKPSWLSFSCKDAKHLNDGSTIQEAVSLLHNHPTLFAIGVNCTQPMYISEIIKTIKASNKGDKKIIVYPNSGEAYNTKSKTWMGVSDSESYIAMVREWAALGADIIGGCCQIGPEHIQGICKMLQK